MLITTRATIKRLKLSPRSSRTTTTCCLLFLQLAAATCCCFKTSAATSSLSSSSIKLGSADANTNFVLDNQNRNAQQQKDDNNYQEAPTSSQTINNNKLNLLIELSNEKADRTISRTSSSSSNIQTDYDKHAIKPVIEYDKSKPREALKTSSPTWSVESQSRDDELKHGHVHKLMSEQDLRRTFQVATHDQVPEYEVLKLTLSSDGSHLISPISDLGELAYTSSLVMNNEPDVSSSRPAVRHKRSSSFQRAQENFGAKTAGERVAETVSQEAAAQDDAKTTKEKTSDENKLIVINLSTFGRDFNLRLKRNADFQQRIKDMKMFLVESTKDGQLRYTVDALLAARPSGAPNNSSDKQSAEDDQWNLGTTYHDEDNLAALLIEQDKRTGELKVDGTIGNDFVIKPMPKATLELLMKRHQRPSAATVKRTSGDHKTGNSSTSTFALKATSSETPATAASSSESTRAELERAAQHMHDDDPHDDDEMFLDEDEALELAHQSGKVQQGANLVKVASKGELPQTKDSSSKKPSASSSSASHYQQQQQPRTLSKAASELKWRKYRKLIAQTQVPKLTSLSASSSSTQDNQSTTLAESGRQRARRQASAELLPELNQPAFKISHHIVYRQKPSAEGSSSQHQHSFLNFAESMAQELGAPRLQGSSEKQRAKRSDHSSRAQSRLASSATNNLDEENLTDFEEDPLGGQFYLEPGALPAGFESSRWSLISSASSRALPPYALNSSSELESSRRRLADNGFANSTKRDEHIRSKRHAQGPRIDQRNRQPLAAQSRNRHKRQAPDTVWPEVLLVVDYDSFLLHGGDSRDVKRYFVSFWNGVDLRYKLLVHPHIRISLAGMIVAKDRDATPYLERNRLRAPNADAVDAAGALTDMGKYLYREDRLPTYDLAVVITKLDMCRRRYEGGRCNRGTAGFAYVGGACVVNKRLEKVNSVAIIEDSGGFSGIIVAAHEVGHLLGCVHDGSPPPSYLGGPGATHCPWEDGFIMSDLRHTERGFRWSQCSVEQFKHFLNGETATCLYNYPHESQMLHRLLPGTMLSLDEQCKRDRGTNACFKDARVCAQLFCFDSASGYCVSYRPAAEGSPCGEGQVCRNGKCVGEIENIIPDYTHQSETIVAANGGALSPAAVASVGSARSRASTSGGSLVQSSAPLMPATPPSQPGRLADNGLSASSTSTATSSPDQKSGISMGLSAASTPSQISTRRMDTYAVDLPVSGHQFGAYNSAAIDHGTNLRSSKLIEAQSNHVEPAAQRRSSTQQNGRRSGAIQAASNQLQRDKSHFNGHHSTSSNNANRRISLAPTVTNSGSNLSAKPKSDLIMHQYQTNSEPNPAMLEFNPMQPYEIYRGSNSYISDSDHQRSENQRPRSASLSSQYHYQPTSGNHHFYSPFLPPTSALAAMKVV